MFSTKKIVYTAMLTALGIILPFAFHSVPNAGGIFLPMHIPVLLCGMICGFHYGMICGILTPLLSSVSTGMPPVAMLPQMLCELCVYGMVSGLLIRYVPIKNIYAKIYLSLVGAMLAGRVVYGVLNALIFKAGAYSFKIWLSAAFLTAWPGIIIQILFIPGAILALRKAGFTDFDSRNGKKTSKNE